MVHKPRRCTLIRVLIVATIIVASLGLYPLAASATTLERYYSEAYAETNTSVVKPSWADKCTLTVTPPSTKRYLLINDGVIGTKSGTLEMTAQLIGGQTGAETQYASVDYRPRQTLSYASFSNIKVVELTGGTEYTFKVQFAVQTGYTGTVYMRDTNILLIELTSGAYGYTESTGSSTSQTSYQDLLTLNFTSSAADYLILASADYASSAASKDANVQMTIDGLATSEAVTTAVSGGDYFNYFMLKKVSLSAAEHTFIMQHKATNPASTTVRNPKITVIPVSDLADVQYAAPETTTANSTTSYTDAATLTWTPTAYGNYWVAIAAYIQSANLGIYAYTNELKDGVQVDEQVWMPDTTGDWETIGHTDSWEQDKTEHVWKAQIKSGTSGKEVSLKTPRIFAARLNTADTFAQSGHTSIYDGTGSIAYVWAHGFTPSTNYNIAYYDAGASGGQKLYTDSNKQSGTYGNIESSINLSNYQESTPGTWRAVIFTSATSPPQNYDDRLLEAGYIVEDSFTVTAQYIPEIPTSLAGIIIAIACFGIYWYIRRKTKTQSTAFSQMG